MSITARSAWLPSVVGKAVVLSLPLGSLAIILASDLMHQHR
jgi:hypothetical protein